MLRFVVLGYTSGASIDLYVILFTFCRKPRTEDRRDHIRSCHKGNVIRLDGGLDVRIICITIKEKIGKSRLFDVGRICGL